MVWGDLMTVKTHKAPADMRDLQRQLNTLQWEIAVATSAMTVIRNVTERRLHLRDMSKERALLAAQTLSSLMHNFVPGDVNALAAVRSQFEQHYQRDPEIFEHCHELMAWLDMHQKVEG